MLVTCGLLIPFGSTQVQGDVAKAEDLPDLQENPQPKPYWVEQGTPEKPVNNWHDGDERPSEQCERTQWELKRVTADKSRVVRCRRSTENTEDRAPKSQPGLAQRQKQWVLGIDLVSCQRNLLPSFHEQPSARQRKQFKSSKAEV